MRKATLQFLNSERDELYIEIGLLEAGRREVVEVGATGRKNITLLCIERMLQRLGRFEEMIAAYEARLG